MVSGMRDEGGAGGLGLGAWGLGLVLVLLLVEALVLSVRLQYTTRVGLNSAITHANADGRAWGRLMVGWPARRPYAGARRRC